MGQWWAEVTAAAPDALRALYQFGDPAGIGRGWVGLAIMALWLGPLFALPLYIARRTYGRREWVSATMGVMAGASLLWWVHGILPHGWIQFTESNRELLAGRFIPSAFQIEVSEEYVLDIASNLYSVVVEGTLGGLMIGGIVVTVLAILRIQRMLPKTLAPGEAPREQPGEIQSV